MGSGVSAVKRASPPPQPAPYAPGSHLGLRSPGAEATVNLRLVTEVAGPMYAFLNLVSTVIQIYIWLLIAQAVLSWLVAFGVANRHHRLVSVLGDFLWRITDPLLRPIRRVLPDLGGIDVSPVILILLLYFIRNLMFEYLV